MSLTLKKALKNVTIVQGYPGFGLVGTIATEYLLEHLEVESVGRILITDQPALIAIHEGRVVEPIGLFYNKKNNLLIVHAINATTGMEWEIAQYVLELAHKVSAKEIISIEGVGSPDQTSQGTGGGVEGEENESQQYRIFSFTNSEEKQKLFKKLKLAPLKEGIIMGVTSALLLEGNEDFTISCIFGETRTHLPDSKAAANVLEALSRYLDIELDIGPLIESAERFEEKLRSVIQQSRHASAGKKSKKDLTYLG